MKSILVVCEGNICRSPMAEAVLKTALPDIRVRSAGLRALHGHAADEMAIRLMQARGLDLTRHRARQLSLQLCLEADLILVMESAQRHRLIDLYPATNGRVFRFADHLGLDVPDPYRRPEVAFVNALMLIDEGAGKWADRIRRLT